MKHKDIMHPITKETKGGTIIFDHDDHNYMNKILLERITIQMDVIIDLLARIIEK